MIRRVIRPLWIVGVTWALVCLIGAWLPVNALYAAAGISAIVTVTVLCVPTLRRWRGLLLSVLTVLPAIGVLLYCEVTYYQSVADKVGEQVSLCVEVQDNAEFRELKVLSGDLPAGTRLRLWSEPLDAALDPYDIVTATFELHPIEAADGLALRQQKASGVSFAVMSTDFSAAGWIVKDGEPPTIAVISAWREELVIGIQRYLSGDVGAVVTGICLGADDALSRNAVSDFRTCGVSHLFAVSGLHLSILTQALLWLLKRLRVSRRLRGVICSAAIVLFSLLVGSAPSVVRAAVLCLVVVVGDCLRRQADARNSMGLALLLLLAVDPFAVYDAGLLLSFLATFGLLFLSPTIQRGLLSLPIPEKLKSVASYLAGTVAVTLSATLATLPVCVLYFGYLSTVSVLANLVMTIPSSALLITGWLAILALPLGFSWVYRPLLWLAGYCARFLLWVAAPIARFPFSTVGVTDTYLVIGVLGGMALVGVGWLLLRRRGLWLASVLCVLSLCIGVTFHQYRMWDVVRFYTIPNEADLAVCVMYRHQTVLVIAPTEANTAYAVRSALQAAGVTSLDAVFLPAGEWGGVPYLTRLLNEYLTEAVIYRESDAPVMLTKNSEAVWGSNRLHLRFGGTDAVFDFGALSEEKPPADANLVFCNGAVTDTTEGSLVVVQNATADRYSENCLTDTNQLLPWLWVNSDGEILIK